jgi:serine/threonine protein kinase
MPSDSRKPPSKIANGKYEIDKKLGAGCFGEVWRGHDSQSKQLVAVKFEDYQAQSSQLEHEVEILRLMKKGATVQPQGFAECFYWGREGRHHCMVMELLGKSLEDRVQECKGKLTVQSTVLVAEQIIRRIEYLHHKGFIHRDIKPENFMFGVKDKVHVVYLIDFGLSKRYFDSRHNPMRTKLSLTGTARYASINAHKGHEQSRRDDLEAIGHMLMYFLRGVLPWSGLEARTQEEKYNRIRETKEKTQLDDLCAGYPDAFKQFLYIARNLDYKERPDYDGYRKMFADVRAKLNPKPQDYEFQWLQGKSDLDRLMPLGAWEPLRQPDDEGKTGPRTSGSGISGRKVSAGAGPSTSRWWCPWCNSKLATKD